MAEILSQEEINALLAAINEEEEEESAEAPDEARASVAAAQRLQGRVKPYDFARPNKLSKDQLRTLQIMHESFARGLATALSAYLRTYVEAEVVSTDAMLYEEFSRMVSNPGIMAIFTIPPLDGSVVLEVNPDIGFAILDRLLGGPGSIPKTVRELTEIEQPVMRRVVERIMDNLNAAWDHVISLSPRFEQLEVNPQFTQLVPPRDIVVVIGLEVSLRSASGRVNLCIPYDVIEPVVPKLSAHYLFISGKKETSAEEETALKERLKRLDVSVRVLLGRAEVSLQELLDLEEGDYISLDTPTDGLLPVYVGERLKFLGRPGRSGRNMAVELVAMADPEEGLEK